MQETSKNNDMLDKPTLARQETNYIYATKLHDKLYIAM